MPAARRAHRRRASFAAIPRRLEAFNLVGSRLVPASTAVPAAAYKKNDKDDDEKRREIDIHVSLL
jgi:hypothetical protein